VRMKQLLDVVPSPAHKFVNTTRGSSFSDICFHDLPLDFSLVKDNIHEPKNSKVEDQHDVDGSKIIREVLPVEIGDTNLPWLKWEIGDISPFTSQTKEEKSRPRSALDMKKYIAIFVLLSTVLASPEEPTRKSKRVKRPSNKSFDASTPVTKIAPSAAKVKPFVTNKGTGVKPRVPDVNEEELTKSEAESWGKDEDDSNNKHDSRSEGSDQERDSGDDNTLSDSEKGSDFEHETDENESCFESDQEENEEEIEDDEEEEEGEFVKTPSNDSDDEDETKIKDKAEGDEDKGMDYTTNQFNDDVDLRINEPVTTDEGFIQKGGIVTESLEHAVLTKESSQPKSTYEAAASFTEFEECYDELIKSYNLDKSLFLTYDKVYLLKRSRKDKDKDEDPSTGSNRGLKKRKISKDVEPKTEEPEFEVVDSDMPQDQEENLGKTPQQGPTQSWLMTLTSSVDKPSKTFDELMSTRIDFSSYIINGLKITNLIQETLLGSAFKLLKGTRNNYAELEYDFEECYKALSEKLDWDNPEGGNYPFDLTKPLHLVKNGNRQMVPVDYFFKKDLKYLQGGISTMTYTTSIKKTKSAQYDLLGEGMAQNIWSPVKVAYDKHLLWGTSH
nr:HXXXD-type acyl-transferase family protein [Tanacetum cinerariifolium]